VSDLKVDEQAEFPVAEFEIGEKLRLVQWQHLVDRFELHHYDIFDKQGDSVAHVDTDTLVDERQWMLGAHFATSTTELIDEASLVSTLQQPGTQSRVNLHRGIDHDPAHVFEFSNGKHLCALCDPLRPPRLKLFKDLKAESSFL
jgi:hypothetical protein